MKLSDLNKITVNIPTLNEEKNIIDCIKSIKKSGIKKIIVIDGGSTDKTIKLIKSQKVKLIRVKKKDWHTKEVLVLKIHTLNM